MPVEVCQFTLAWSLRLKLQLRCSILTNVPYLNIALRVTNGEVIFTMRILANVLYLDTSIVELHDRLVTLRDIPQIDVLVDRTADEDVGFELVPGDTCPILMPLELHLYDKVSNFIKHNTKQSYYIIYLLALLFPLAMSHR